MRASRLVNLLLILQTRGGLTARELAEELEVSVRTIHRDVDALSAAGVPIFAERGPHGGIRLVDGYRTRLTGMTADEAEALFLGGLPGPAAELGLGTVVAAARLKVLAALPAELRSRASRLVERFHLDAAGWFQAGEPVPHLAAVAEAVWEGRPLRIEYRRDRMPVARDLGPLGVVLKGGVWYLVASADGQIRTYRVSRIVSAAPMTGAFERPAGFDLAAYWTESSAAYERDSPRIAVVVRVAEDRVGALVDAVGRSMVEAAERLDGPGSRRLASAATRAELARRGPHPAPRGGLEHRGARAAGGARAAHRDRDTDPGPLRGGRTGRRPVHDGGPGVGDRRTRRLRGLRWSVGLGVLHLPLALDRGLHGAVAIGLHGHQQLDGQHGSWSSGFAWMASVLSPEASQTYLPESGMNVAKLAPRAGRVPCRKTRPAG